MTFIIHQRTLTFCWTDDTDLLYADKNLFIRFFENIVNTELTNGSKWLMANKLS